MLWPTRQRSGETAVLRIVAHTSSRPLPRGPPPGLRGMRPLAGKVMKESSRGCPFTRDTLRAVSKKISL